MKQSDLKNWRLNVLKKPASFVAKKLGLTTSAIYQYESGARKMRFETKTSLKRVFRITIE